MNKFPQLGQLFMVGFPGNQLDDSTLRLIRELGVNNFILFRRNVKSPEQVRVLCRELRDACRGAGLPGPLISIDQEGGTVARLPLPFTQFDDARTLAESQDPERALGHYIAACVKELSEAGINMNLAPVLDVCPAGEGYFMEKRVFGGDPAHVGRLGAYVVKGFQQGGIAACGKHFPGLGAAKLDPHLQLPVVSRPLEQIKEIDLVPFLQAVAAGIAAIMTSHTIYTDLDPQTPATLSRRVLKGLLRDELGFHGLIITDDLEMGAIENERSVAGAAVQAFRAGADLLLICHDHEKIRQAYNALQEAVAKKEVTQQDCDDALQRVSFVRRQFAGKP
ncbi:MAG: beta-N-acetylhexosaminidase [Pseudomonadota bacterium]